MPGLLATVGGFLLRDSDPALRVVVGDADETVEVDAFDGEHFDLEVAPLEGRDEFFERPLALHPIEKDRVAFHRALRVIVEPVVLALGRRVAVVTLNMLPMIARPKPLRITRQSHAVSMTHAVEPVIPGEHETRIYDRAAIRSSNSTTPRHPPQRASPERPPCLHGAETV
jgi:hypothetical protein